MTQSEHRLLDPGPLVQELERWREIHNLNTLSQFSGVSDRTLRRHVNGHTEHIRFDNADRIATAMGMTLSAIYPLNPPY